MPMPPPPIFWRSSYPLMRQRWMRERRVAGDGHRAMRATPGVKGNDRAALEARAHVFDRFVVGAEFEKPDAHAADTDLRRRRTSRSFRSRPSRRDRGLRERARSSCRECAEPSPAARRRRRCEYRIWRRARPSTTVPRTAAPHIRLRLRPRDGSCRWPARPARSPLRTQDFGGTTGLPIRIFS